MVAEPVYRVVVRIEVEQGTGPAFEQAWAAVGDSVAHVKGNLGQWLARSATERDTYYVTSDWVDETAFRGLERSERHREHRRIIDRFRVGGAMTQARVLAHIPPARPDSTVRVLLYLSTDDPEQLLKCYHEVSAAMEGTPGLLANELLGSPHWPGKYVVASEWSSLAEFQRWEQGPDHRDTTAPIRPYQDPTRSPPFGVYQVLASW